MIFSKKEEVKGNICDLVDSQVDSLVAREMKQEDVDGRGDILGGFGPKHETESDWNAYSTPNLKENNNPSYQVNLVDRLNTPFDHLERIFLQDFSSVIGSESFKDLSSRKSVDSYTFTPFIDYATKDERVGIYQDEYLLTKWNTGYFDVKGNQPDTDRRKITSTIFRLMNLEKDLYDAKTEWRNAVKEQDSKVYIYTFCEHLFNLFAKLSNIRLCKSEYGFKSPHLEWEGVLALDIWYQTLYNKIDKEYFGEDFFNPKNQYESPMKVNEDGSLEWNQTVYESLSKSARNIKSDRQNKTTPRGVLKILDSVISSDWNYSDVLRQDESGDFPYFERIGNDYSDSDKSIFTKYPSLHFGHAFNVMSPKEYCEFIGGGELDFGEFVKPPFMSIDGKGGFLKNMLERGCKTILDAFKVVRAEKMFNVYNSRTQKVEEFKSANANDYSQGQCALAIERIFARIYEYLQFKATTTESMEKHINFDVGFKYLTTDSILDSDNGIVSYYDPMAGGHSNYIDKVASYLESDVLADDEKEVLEKAVGMLRKLPQDHLDKKWNLCPFLADGVGERHSELICNSRAAAYVPPRTFNVTFKFVDDDGNEQECVEQVIPNSKLPKFHLHKNGDSRFSHWRLVSGNLSSSMTVLSDLELVAEYYDVSYDSSSSSMVVESSTSHIADGYVKEESSEFNCPYVSDEVNIDGNKFCKFCGIVPNAEDDGYLRVCCFKVNESDVPYSEQNDFAPMTLVEISDVSILLKALLKINIDIAVNEMYIKDFLPNESDWWYGYRESDKWISFEPTVELKFCNLHWANQIDVNGKLLCTVDGANPNYSIVPINGKLSEDVNGKRYSDIYYYQDYYWQFKGEGNFKDSHKHYEVHPLELNANTNVQSPTNPLEFVKTSIGEIGRNQNQIRTFATTVKKYRPIAMPFVKDIFNDCVNDKNKHQVDDDNDYGIFGWCSIPSKTMVDMECNEESLYVPSEWGCGNRVGGDKFLRLDSDFERVYVKEDSSGRLVSTVSDSWYYMYSTRDWTYFLSPFFNVVANNEIYSTMLDEFKESNCPLKSDHINGVIFEPSNKGRQQDESFGGIAIACKFLAERHHSEGNLGILADMTNVDIGIGRLRQLTMVGEDFNGAYGSEFRITDGVDVAFSDKDIVDEFDKTSSNLKYKFNLGQRHSIDDYDDSSVWFYITMTTPVEEIGNIEIEDIMPFVFWWSNRGVENNGTTAQCYGLSSNAKLNYEQGGWCYESSFPKTNGNEKSAESRWHSVQRTLGVDFSKPENGGAVLTQDNSGNCYKGAYDSRYSLTDEKWKVHHPSNQFGMEQDQDISEDKYYPMQWSLWYAVRHYVYITEFKNNGNLDVNLDIIDRKTKKIVKAIYRTYKEKSEELFDSPRIIGNRKLVKWTNSFVQIQSILERNDREHEASLVLFTGHDVSSYSELRNSESNFRITTLDGVDYDDDGISPNFNGMKFNDLQASFIVGDKTNVVQMDKDHTIDLNPPFDIDEGYPYCEYLLNDNTRKWIRKISETVMNTQFIPFYTTMETMGKSHHKLTVDDMKGITFQVVPQLYWKYEWTYNEFMIHPVGRLDAPKSNSPMYDMLGNVWELTKSEFVKNVQLMDGQTNTVNEPSDMDEVTIKGGAFNELARKVISSSREGIGRDTNHSENSSVPNVGFRPALEYVGKGGGLADKLDIFFLFDASSSQYNQITEMVNSANGIVDQFIGEDIDVRVGSALFLGPTIRMMCSRQYEKREFKYWVSSAVTTYNESESQTKEGYYPSTDIAETYGGTFSMMQKYCNGLSASWDGETWPSESRSAKMMMFSREGSTSGGHTINTGGGREYKGPPVYTKYVYSISKTHLSIHAGINPKIDPHPIYTYDIAEGQNHVFDYPFWQGIGDNGFLVNLYAGCEPTCHMVSRLIGNMMFEPANNNQTPYNSVFYMFRPNVPRLIFVFTNEFDNEFKRGYTWTYGTSIQNSIVLPVLESGVSTKLNLFSMKKYPSDNIDPLDPLCLWTLRDYKNSFGEYLDSVNLSTNDDVVNQMSALDKLYDILKCGSMPRLQISQDNAKIVDGVYNVKYVKNSNLSFPYNFKHYLEDSNESLWKICADTAYYGYSVLGSLSYTYLSSAKPSDVLPYSQIVQLKEVNTITPKEELKEKKGEPRLGFLGMHYTVNSETNFKFSYADWNVANTLGFYELNRAAKTIQTPANVFLMVSDANSPSRLFETKWHIDDNFKIVDNDGVEAENQELALKEIQMSLFLHNSSSQFSFIEDIAVDIDGYEDEGLTWKTLNKSCFAWHRRMDNMIYDGENNSAGDLNNGTRLGSVFGGFTSIFEKNTIIYAQRYKNITDFVNANKTNEEAFVIGVPFGNREAFNGNKFKKVHVDEFLEGKKTEYKNKYGETTLTESGELLWEVEYGKWRDHHICPTTEWNSRQRAAEGKMCRYNLTYDNYELFGYGLTTSGNTTDDIYRAPLKQVFSAESFTDIQGGSIFKNEPENYITVSYKDSDGNITGTLKVVVITGTSVMIDTAGTNSTQTITYNKSDTKAWKLIMVDNVFQPNWKPYPIAWRYGVRRISEVKGGDYSIDKYPQWTDIKVIKFVQDVYDNLKKALPLMMSCRFQKQLFDNIENRDGKSVSDYTDSKNTTIMKALPIMDSNKIVDVFNNSFNANQLFNGGFSYDSAVLDIGSGDKDFPLSFENIADVNTDEYKTAKLVLTRFKDISADNSDTFTMGSSNLEYSEITDTLKLTYRDKDAITSSSKNDNAKVTLTNGGYSELDEKDDDGNDIRNKHLFIDPFELTISQWCHVNGKHTIEDAREFLGDELDDIERTYYAYMEVWEPYVAPMKPYNPLGDTRPYYHSTYNKVLPFLGKLNTAKVKTDEKNIPEEDEDTQEFKFDLPTEAQWEYACRGCGKYKLAFPNANLGDIYETNSRDLDLIAWYKYKIVGTKPEPERFAAWRISKMLFGITKDKEQVNNVYEKT